MDKEQLISCFQDTLARTAAEDIPQPPEDFVDWRAGNPYCGKRFSVLGDSISTFEGCNPPGHRVFYTGETCQRSGVRDVEKTWWWKVIDFLGGELAVNDSWSGSRVTMLPNGDPADPFPSGCSKRRTHNLSGKEGFLSRLFGKH